MLRDLKAGDVVTRMLAGTIPIKLKVTKVTDERIICGWWEFDRATGAEIDEDLNWGPPPLRTGSYIKEDDGSYAISDPRLAREREEQ